MEVQSGLLLVGDNGKGSCILPVGLHTILKVVELPETPGQRLGQGAVTYPTPATTPLRGSASTAERLSFASAEQLPLDTSHKNCNV